MSKKILLIASALWVILFSCKKGTSSTATSTPAKAGPQLVFVFKFDSTQTRLNNFGQVAAVPAGHSGISPVINLMSSHYVELARTALDSLGKGVVLFRAPEVGSGPNLAIDFSKSVNVKQGQPFLTVPLSSVPKGSYQWLRVSLAYQNYNIKYSLPTYGLYNLTGTIASFVGFNTNITSYKIKDSTVVVNGNRAQGYWGFEDQFNVATGQPPAGSTTVPNPIFASSPIPAGSCVVTGQFATPFAVSGSETQNDTITVSLSINKSFEFTDKNGNGLFEPLNGDSVVNMGIRGLIPIAK